MNNTLRNENLSKKDIYFFRQLQKNMLFESVTAFFAKRVETDGLTKKKLATLLGKDPAQITRWFSGPNNWTLDTISDLLLAMDAEPRMEIVDIRENNATNINYGIATDNQTSTTAKIVPTVIGFR